MVMFSPGDRSEKIGMSLDELLSSGSWGEIWRATHDSYGKILVVAYKREPGKELFLACHDTFTTWKRLAAKGVPGLLPIHKIVSSGKVPMLLVEDPGGANAREFFNSKRATLKKTARMIRACCRTLQRVKSESLLPVGITPDTIFIREGAEDYPAWLLPVTPGVIGTEVRLGEGRYMSAEAIAHEDPGKMNADVFSLGWIWAELLSRNFEIEHREDLLPRYVHYPKLLGIIKSALRFKDERYQDPGRLEFEADQWLDNDADEDRKAFDKWWEEKKQARRDRKRKAEESGAPGASPDDSPEQSVSPADLEEDDVGEFRLVDIDVPPKHQEAGENLLQEEEEPAAFTQSDDLSFGSDIPPIGEPAEEAPKELSAEADFLDSPRRPEPPPPMADSGDAPPGSNTIPILIALFFVIMLVGAFSAGVWVLFRGGSSTSTTEVAEIEPDEIVIPAELVGIQDGSSGEPDDAEVTELSATSEDGSATIRVSVDPDSPVQVTAVRIRTPGDGLDAPASVETLIQRFRQASENQDLDALRVLWYQADEFESVRGLLANILANQSSPPSFRFVPGPRPAMEGNRISRAGSLQVTNTALNLEIPVGVEDGAFYLTSIGRVGESIGAVATPVPTDPPLEFALRAKGTLATSAQASRLARFGLGDAAQASVSLRAGDDNDLVNLSMSIDNGGATQRFYRYVVLLRNGANELLGIASGGGHLDASARGFAHENTIPMGISGGREAQTYEALWYESETPIGLVGRNSVKNSRIPVNFARAFAYEMGPGGFVKGRIFTGFVDNQKVIIAPAILENKEPGVPTGIFASAFFDESGALLTGASQVMDIPAGEPVAFEQIICYLPQSDYGRVRSFQSVFYLNGIELGRASGELPLSGDEAPEPLAATPRATPTPTATPILSSAGRNGATAAAEPLEIPEPEAIDSADATDPGDQRIASVAESDPDDPGEGGTPDIAGLLEADSGEESIELPAWFGFGFLIATVVFGYFIPSFCYQKILEKSDKQDWIMLAWIPGINWAFVPWAISGRSLAFPIFVYLFPCIGIFFYLAMWYDVCIQRGKSGIWAFVVLFVPIVAIPYLAFSE